MDREEQHDTSSQSESKTERLRSDTNKKINEIKNAWKKRDTISTLPSWGQMQNQIIQLCKASLPDVDEETKAMITRELLLTLRCHGCERARSDECNFSVCIRGLLSGIDIGGL